jgi:hypothetical protein
MVKQILDGFRILIRGLEEKAKRGRGDFLSIILKSPSIPLWQTDLYP